MTQPDPIPSPVFVPPPEHIRKIHGQVELIKRLSDRVVGIGPFGVGLDGLLAWIPGAGGVYGAGAGALLIFNAFRAGAKPGTIVRMAGYLVADVATGSVPVLGDAVDFFFPAHLMAANALQKDMVERHGPMEPPKLRSVGKGSAVAKRRSKSAIIIGILLGLGLLAVVWIFAGGIMVRSAAEAFEAGRGWIAARF